jgi:hypothetical protein
MSPVLSAKRCRWKWKSQAVFSTVHVVCINTSFAVTVIVATFIAVVNVQALPGKNARNSLVSVIRMVFAGDRNMPPGRHAIVRVRKKR